MPVLTGSGKCAFISPFYYKLAIYSVVQRKDHDCSLLQRFGICQGFIYVYRLYLGYTHVIKTSFS